MFLLSIESFLVVGIAAAISFAVMLIKYYKDKSKPLNIARMVVLYIFFYFVSLILSLTAGGYSIDSLISEVRLNFVPFIDITTNTLQYVQNILLFVPLGLLVPLLWNTFEKPSHAIIMGALFSLSIEITQLFSYRATDIDDLIMNTLGALLGWVVFTLLHRIAPKAVSTVREHRIAPEALPTVREHENSRQRQEVLLCFVLAWLVILVVYPFLLDYFFFSNSAL